MSGAGRPPADPVDAAGLTLAIAATHWHAEITDSLVARALAAAAACRVADPPVVQVRRPRCGGVPGRGHPRRHAAF